MCALKCHLHLLLILELLLYYKESQDPVVVMDVVEIEISDRERLYSSTHSMYSLTRSLVDMRLWS